MDFVESEDFIEDHEVTLSSYMANEGDKMVYSYDFGDHMYPLIEIIKEHDRVRKAETQKYDLIITDYEMPNMDGCEFLTKVREIIGYKYTPVIIFSARDYEDNKDKWDESQKKSLELLRECDIDVIYY